MFHAGKDCAGLSPLAFSQNVLAMKYQHLNLLLRPHSQFSSLLSQYRLSSLSKIRLRAFKSCSMSHLRASWSGRDSVMC